MHYNEKSLPETQFLKINYKEVILNSFFKERISKNYVSTRHSNSNFFIEQYKENLVNPYRHPIQQMDSVSPLHGE